MNGLDGDVIDVFRAASPFEWITLNEMIGRLHCNDRLYRNSYGDVLVCMLKLFEKGILDLDVIKSEVPPRGLLFQLGVAFYKDSKEPADE